MSADFELGGWTIRPDRLIVERNGDSVHVKPKTMEVLVALATRAGEVLTRDELIERVWQGACVSDDVITQAIAELRRAVKDDFRRPTFVETVPRRGYRVLASVRPLGHQPGDEAAIAVRDPRASSVRIWPRRHVHLPLAAAAALLCLIGLALGGGYRLTGDLLSRLLVLRTSAERPSSIRPTFDTEAYELYLRARREYQPYATDANMISALALAHRAVERDPRFADAYALIAEIQTFRGFWNFGARDPILAEASEAARAAIGINPRLSYPHAVAGLASAVLEWKWEDGYREAERAIELDPEDVRSLSLVAALSLTRGKTAEAVALAHRAYELQPIDPNALATLGWVLYQARQYNQAAAFMGKTLELDPDAEFARTFRPLALAQAGQHEAALAAEREQLYATPSATRERLALIHVLAGRPRQARQLLADAPPGDTFARVRARLGDTQPLLDMLDAMLKRRMTNYLMWLRTGPTWDPVRDDPRFHHVLQQVGLT